MVLELSTTKYACNICHKSYDSRGEAEECEKRDDKNQKIENIERIRTFTITKDHLNLLRKMYVEWDDCEYGAPCINPKRPYGNSDVEDDIAEIIKFPKKGNWDSNEEMWNEEATNKIYLLHRQMQIVLQIVLITGKFEEGTYKKKDDYDSLSWYRIDGDSVKEKKI
jgi:hypothetical protein